MLELAGELVPPLLVPLPVLLVPFPAEVALIAVLGCVTLGLLELELLDPAEVPVPEVVVALDTGLDSGPPDSVEQDAMSVGITAHKAAERKGDKWIMVMGELPANLER